MNKPFHLSFVVPELRLAEGFYVDFLGCKKGRDTRQWIDIIFFGHQLTLHQETESMKAHAIDHFGIILERDEWLSISQKVSKHNIPFVLPPTEKTNEDKSESGKFIIKDPAGNLIEFKFYKKAFLELGS